MISIWNVVCAAAVLLTLLFTPVSRADETMNTGAATSTAGVETAIIKHPRSTSMIRVLAKKEQHLNTEDYYFTLQLVEGDKVVRTLGAQDRWSATQIQDRINYFYKRAYIAVAIDCIIAFTGISWGIHMTRIKEINDGADVNGDRLLSPEETEARDKKLKEFEAESKWSKGVNFLGTLGGGVNSVFGNKLGGTGSVLSLAYFANGGWLQYANPLFFYQKIDTLRALTSGVNRVILPETDIVRKYLRGDDYPDLESYVKYVESLLF